MPPLEQLNTALSGRYALEREAGAGGMATVYLARDIRHNRKVAVKVLRPELGAVLGVERFLSEIQVTANLQHPNLLPLFDSGEADGLLYYVMPFIEGESLRGRLSREKQLPLEDAIRIAVAVAGALDYAHRHGVIHRDLKPENILLHDGQPLVADFGIALAVSNAGGARITQTGISLGTPQYMSPEQATGDREVDGRTDIYSLGAITYEMIAGEPPHAGPTAQSIIAKLMTEEVRPLTVLRRTATAAVDAAVRHALEKLPADRFATAHEFAAALEGRLVTSAPGVGGPPRVQKARITRQALRSPVWPAVALVALASAAWQALRPERVPSSGAIRYALSLLPNTRINPGAAAGSPVTLSPDGRLIAYVALGGGYQQQLFLRSADDVRPRPIAGTEGALQPFFSPDGEWIGFIARSQLKKVSVRGGQPIPLAEVPQTFGASWGKDGDIVVAVAGKGLHRTRQNGGALVPIGVPDTNPNVTYRWPRILADGKTIVASRWTGGNNTTARLVLVSLPTGQLTPLDVPGAYPLGVLDGQLVYGTGANALMAAPFDLKRLRVTGSSLQVLDQVRVDGPGNARADLSASGSLVYQAGVQSSQVVLADVGGVSRVLIAEPRGYTFARFSPDGRKVALAAVGPTTTDIWIADLQSGIETRLTTEGATNDRPEWWPDGKRVLYRSDRGGSFAMWWQPVDGSGPPEPLVSDANVWETVVAPDSRALVYRTGTWGGADIWYRKLQDTARQPIANTHFEEWAPRISPDGKWLAYTSNESSNWEIYVRPFPGAGPRYQVSSGGGENPVWSRNPQRLFYQQGQQIVSVAFTMFPSFVVTERKALFEGDFYYGPGHATYDVTSDGRHFLLLKPNAGEVQVLVVHNWRSELRARTGLAETTR